MDTAVEHDMRRGKPRGQDALQRLDVHPAEARGVRGVQPPDILLRGVGGELLQHGGMGELQAADSIEESSRHHLAGKLHEPQAAEQARPAQRRQLVLQELAEDHPVALQHLADPVPDDLLFIQGVTGRRLALDAEPEPLRGSR